LKKHLWAHGHNAAAWRELRELYRATGRQADVEEADRVLASQPSAPRR
jgi:hypothetical protein